MKPLMKLVYLTFERPFIRKFCGYALPGKASFAEKNISVYGFFNRVEPKMFQKPFFSLACRYRFQHIIMSKRVCSKDRWLELERIERERERERGMRLIEQVRVEFS